MARIGRAFPNRTIVSRALASAAGGNNLVTVPAANITFAGAAPSIVQPHRVTVPAANITFVGAIPTIKQGHEIQVPAASITFAGRTPAINRKQSVVVLVAQVSFTANAPTVTNSSVTAVVVGGGHTASGGGKRHLPNLDELDTFKRLTRRKRGQTIVEALREVDEPAVEPTTVEKVAAAAEKAVAVAPAAASPPDLNTKLAELVERLESTVATLKEASKPPVEPDTSADDAEVLSIILALL